jgi:hypothetical protein
MRTLALAMMLGACTPDTPSIDLIVRDGGLQVSLVHADSNHVFAPTTATLNGQALVTTPMSAGRISVAVPLDMLPVDATFEFVEGVDHFLIELPTLGAPRSVIGITPLDQPFHGGDPIEITTGIDSDQLTDGLLLVDTNSGETPCGSAMKTELLPHSVRITPDAAWECGMPGTPTTAMMLLGVDYQPQISACTGPELTCTFELGMSDQVRMTVTLL